MEGTDSKKKRTPTVTGAAAGGGVGLTDDLIVDILSRAPVKSTCRFKCVSPSWRSLISHPDNRKKLPQTLVGFFYFDEFDCCEFVSVAELLLPPPPPPQRYRRLRPPSLCDFAFLPANTGGWALDCCNGLVLLNSRRSEQCASYVVCNPATEKWTTVPPVPEPTQAGKICVSGILCFDPAVSPHFHVVRLLQAEADEDDGFTEEIPFEGFEIYSSETGGWVFHPRNSGWSPHSHRSRRTYFNGFLHFINEHSVAALDMKGQTQSTIPVPRSGDVELIGHSLGQLFYANRNDRNTYKLSIYVLESHSRWTLKHCVDTSGLLAGAEYLQSGLLVGVAGIHPHCNSIFLFDSLQGRLMFYNMDSRSARVISSVSSDTCLWSFVPYVPLYLETSALENSN